MCLPASPGSGLNGGPKVRLPQLGPDGLEAYHKLVAKEHFTPHCRADITEWGTRTSEPAAG